MSPLKDTTATIVAANSGHRLRRVAFDIAAGRQPFLRTDAHRQRAMEPG
ncbi:hypothetical protein [Nocardia cyriacigeorgica]|nr:hypothetical protein [Nocardia cyriacigeorgica]